MVLEGAGLLVWGRNGNCPQLLVAPGRSQRVRPGWSRCVSQEDPKTETPQPVKGVFLTRHPQSKREKQTSSTSPLHFQLAVEQQRWGYTLQSPTCSVFAHCTATLFMDSDSNLLLSRGCEDVFPLVPFLLLASRLPGGSGKCQSGK